ncbi:MAG: AI-2E family transporter [Desulfuromonadaceae bacterium]|nr:AI-2E family transporter [Desulfuromonadaceae bacterium]
MLSTGRYIRFVVIALGLLALFIFLQWLVKSSINVVFLLFAGLLFAIFIRGLSRFIFDRFPVIPESVGITITLLFLFTMFLAFFILLVPQLTEQMPKLVEELSKAQNLLKEKSADFRWFGDFIQSNNDTVANFGQELTSKVFGVFAGTFGVITSLFVVFFIGLYLCFAPYSYLAGIFALVPTEWHKRTDEIVYALDYTLSHWLIGRFVGMLMVSVLSYVGLLILGVPLPLNLAVLAGILTFVPNVGPVISAIPAILLGYLVTPATALYVTLLYLGIQGVESYLVTPLIQQRQISLPPVLMLVAQVVFANIYGFLGLLLATPLTAVAIVLVKMLYIEDVLGKTTDVHSSGSKMDRIKG